jgi:hypothetical protein
MCESMDRDWQRLFVLVYGCCCEDEDACIVAMHGCCDEMHPG